MHKGRLQASLILAKALFFAAAVSMSPRAWAARVVQSPLFERGKPTCLRTSVSELHLLTSSKQLLRLLVQSKFQRLKHLRSEARGTRAHAPGYDWLGDSALLHGLTTTRV